MGREIVEMELYRIGTDADNALERLAALKGWTPNPQGYRQRVLVFTRTERFEHSIVHREAEALSYAERRLQEMATRAGIAVECTKDGSVFDGPLEGYDAFVFVTLGNLTLPSDPRFPPMTERGKRRLLAAIEAGMGFCGIHSAASTFTDDGIDPYIAMLGAEFCGHGPQQEAEQILTSPAFPGLEGLEPRFRLYEEWYAFKKVSHDMHVILSLDTAGMRGAIYQRPPMPATWARWYGLGRVFYTSMGHREDVWASPYFQQVLLAGLAWSLGNVDADVTSNYKRVTPGGGRYRWVPDEPDTVSR